MAFFKFRKGADESPRAPAQPQSIEAIRQRAKYRLTGATVLVLVGVIGLPMLFDKQPRPIAVDTPIVIPDKNKTPALVIPGAAVVPPTPAVVVAAPDKLPSPAAEPQAGLPTVVGADKNIESKQAPALTDKGSEATNTIDKIASIAAKPEANRAQALLDGKEADAKLAKVDAANTAVAKPTVAADKPAATDSRYVVQVGAFADNARAQEVRMKLERAGLKTYAQAAETKDGRRIRVRLGPFSTRAEAEKAADKVKKLSLPASLLTL